MKRVHKHIKKHRSKYWLATFGFIAVLFMLNFNIFNFGDDSDKGREIVSFAPYDNCTDGIDNDNDGLIDWQYDLGCTGPTDTTEGGKNMELEDGWTVFEPSNDTRIAYVSSSTGNDNWTGLAGEWNGTDGPKKTIKAGYDILCEPLMPANPVCQRTGYPDWLLLKRGDTWYKENINQNVGNSKKEGKNEKELFLIATYGNSTKRARILNGNYVTGPGAYDNYTESVKHKRDFLGLKGIEFYMQDYDPNTPNFSAANENDHHSTRGGLIRTAPGKVFYVEDIHIKYGGSSLDIGGAKLYNFTLRRSIIERSWPGGHGNGHKQGIFINRAPYAKLEENVFDNNGWMGEFDSLVRPNITNMTRWQEVNSGSFSVYINGTVTGFRDLNFSTVNNITEIANVIRNKFDTQLGTNKIIVKSYAAGIITFTGNYGMPIRYLYISDFITYNPGTITITTKGRDTQNNNPSWDYLLEPETANVTEWKITNNASFIFRINGTRYYPNSVDFTVANDMYDIADIAEQAVNKSYYLATNNTDPVDINWDSVTERFVINETVPGFVTLANFNEIFYYDPTAGVDLAKPEYLWGPGADPNPWDQNHNMYLTSNDYVNGSPINITGNIVTRGSGSGIQARAGGDLVRNYFAHNSGTYFGRTDPTPGKYVSGGVYGSYIDNVVMYTENIDGIGNVDAGIEFTNVHTLLAENNIISQSNNNGGQGGKTGIRHDGFYNLTFRNNVIYKYGTGFSIGGDNASKYNRTQETVHIYNNTIQVTDKPGDIPGLKVMSAGGTAILPHVGLYNNTYYSDGDPNRVFTIVGVSHYLSFSHWINYSGETNSEFKKVTFKDPERNASTYMVSLGESDTSFEGFMNKAKSNSRFHWDVKFTSEGINNYIKAGFKLNNTIPECSDGIDNDNDGLVDWQYDLGCYGPGDDTEGGKNAKLDGGWHVYEKHPNARIVYVSSSTGNDSWDGFAGEWNGTSGPRKTIALAADQVRDQTGDWLLLKRGDVWVDESLVASSNSQRAIWNTDTKLGMSKDYPLIIASYGNSTTRPLLKTGNQPGIRVNAMNYFALVGIHFYAHTRDPNSTEFVNYTGYGGGINFLYGNKSILIEDCKSDFYTGNAIQKATAPQYKDVLIRRNIFSNTYSNNSHSQGLFTGTITNMTLEENAFIHTGWLIPNQGIGSRGNKTHGQATLYNHNVYISEGNKTTVRKNLFLQPSSMGTKLRADIMLGHTKILVENNYYTEGEIGVSMGATDAASLLKYVYEDVTIRNNVMEGVGRTVPTKGYFAWNVGTGSVNRLLVENNIMKDQPLYGNTYGIRIALKPIKDAIYRNNIIYDLEGDGILSQHYMDWDNITVQNNTIYDENNNLELVDQEGIFSNNITYLNNKYYSHNPTDEWFDINNNEANITSWNSLSGEIGAETKKPVFKDPGRNISTYLASLGKTDTSLQAFIEEAMNQSKYNWRTEYTAEALNDYIREGFERINYFGKPIFSELHPKTNSGHKTNSVRFKVRATDIQGINNCTLYINNVVNQTIPGSIGFDTHRFSVSNMPAGVYIYKISCINNGGNFTESTTNKFFVLRMRNFNTSINTNLSDHDLSNINNLILDVGNHGRITYTEAVNLSNGYDLDTNVKIRNNFVSIDRTNIPTLNKRARIMLKNLNFNNPKILKDDADCTNCSIINYSGGIINFLIDGFSNYSVGEDNSTNGTSAICGNNLTEGVEVCDGTEINNETCTTQGWDSGTLTCLTDCSDYNENSCSNDDSGSGSGGGGGGGSSGGGIPIPTKQNNSGSGSGDSQDSQDKEDYSNDDGINELHKETEDGDKEKAKSTNIITISIIILAIISIIIIALIIMQVIRNKRINETVNEITNVEN